MMIIIVHDGIQLMIIMTINNAIIMMIAYLVPIITMIILVDSNYNDSYIIIIDGIYNIIINHTNYTWCVDNNDNHNVDGCKILHQSIDGLCNYL